MPSPASSPSRSPSTTPNPDADPDADPAPSSRSSASSQTPSSQTAPARAPRGPAGKGGCWTCRLRRKKCDEKHLRDNACETCLRLELRCLGWGPKKPEWMRDKQWLDGYKASIKAQLIQKGFIRGQPRAAVASAPRRHSLASPPASESFFPLEPGTAPDFVPYGLPSPLGASAPFLPATASDPAVDVLDLNLSPYAYSPQSTTSLPLDFPELAFDFSREFSRFCPTGTQAPAPFELDPPPAPAADTLPLMTEQLSEFVIYYFQNVRQTQFLFAGNTVTNVTYDFVVAEPRGVVTNAICAIASLHCMRARIAQGLESPDGNPELLKYFYDEAWFQLRNASTRGFYSESDALAALHLVSYSLLSGGQMDWKPVLRIACEWLFQTGITDDEDPRRAFRNMSPAGQCAARLTLWFDVFASISHGRPPTYFALYRQLLWRGSDLEHGLGMHALAGCPDEAMLGIAEISALAHWKAEEIRKGSLSTRELVRRGDLIEQELRRSSAHPLVFGEHEPALHPGLAQLESVVQPGPSTAGFLTEEMRRLVASVFHETVVLYLQTVLSDPNPGVPEISASVDVIIQLLHRLPPSEVDRCLVFPICLAACLSDSSVQRDFLKGRLQGQVETIGNLLQTRRLMEAVWQKRDVSGGPVDWRWVLRQSNLNILLV